MKTRRNAEKSTATIIWSEINKKLKYLRYEKIDLLTGRKVKNSSEFYGCIDQNSCENLISLGYVTPIFDIKISIIFVPRFHGYTETNKSPSSSGGF